MDKQIPESKDKKDSTKTPKSRVKSRVKDKAGREKGLLLMELAEIKEISDRIFERIEKKIEVLKDLEASVDEKIAALKRLGQEEESLRTPLETPDRHHAVIALKQGGLKIEEIAGTLSMPLGEVELILNLNKDDHESFSDDTLKTQREQKDYFKEPVRSEFWLRHYRAFALWVATVIKTCGKTAWCYIYKKSYRIIPRKILWAVSFLIGIVIIYIFFLQRNATPPVTPNTEQILSTAQQQESPGEKKSKAIDSIRQKYNIPSTPQTVEQTFKVGEKERQQEGTSKAKEIEQKDQRKTIEVITKTATIRANPSLDSQPVTWASNGVVLEVKEEITNDAGKKWYKIVTSGGKEGWISDKAVRESSLP